MVNFLNIVKQYDILLFDNYGVINFGSGMSKNVLEIMEKLQKEGKKIIILSNASFGAEDAVKKYAKKGMMLGTHYSEVMTSGEFAMEHILRGNFPIAGTRMYVFGTANFKRPDDKLPDMFKGSDFTVTENLDHADFVYCGIPQINYEDRLEIDDFLPELKAIYNRGLTLVCANPDLRANEGGKFVVRQGLIAETYQQMGGKTIIYGKPDPEIYYRVLLDNLAPKSRALMVGDTLRTDIMGANRAGIDSCLVINGGVTEYDLNSAGLEVTEENINAMIAKSGAVPTYVAWQVPDGEL